MLVLSQCRAPLQPDIWNVSSLESYLLLRLCMSGEDNGAGTSRCISHGDRLIKANIIAWIPRCAWVWHTTPTQQGRQWKIHEDDDDIKRKASAPQPQLGSCKTSKCHLTEHSCYILALTWENCIDGPCVCLVLYSLCEVSWNPRRRTAVILRQNGITPSQLQVTASDCGLTVWSRRKKQQHHTQSLNLTMSRDALLQCLI